MEITIGTCNTCGDERVAQLDHDAVVCRCPSGPRELDYVEEESYLPTAALDARLCSIRELSRTSDALGVERIQLIGILLDRAVEDAAARREGRMVAA